MAPTLTQAANEANRGTHDGTVSRNTGALDTFANNIGLGSSSYKPPSDPQLKEVYDNNFRQAEKGK